MKASSKEKLRALRARIGGGAKSAARGLKGSAISGGAGAGSYYIAKMLSEKVDFFKNATGMQKYALPGLLFVGGHFAKRKHHDIGTSLCAVAGFVGAGVFDQAQKEAAANASAPATAKGIDDAGWGGYGDAGALAGGNFNSFPESSISSGVSGYEDGSPSYGSPGEDSYAISNAAMLVD